MGINMSMYLGIRGTNIVLAYVLTRKIEVNFCQYAFRIAMKAILFRSTYM